MESTLFAETVAAVTNLFGPPAEIDQLYGYEAPPPASFLTADQLARRARVRAGAEAELAAARARDEHDLAAAEPTLTALPTEAGAAEQVVADVTQLDARMVLAELRAFSDLDLPAAPEADTTSDTAPTAETPDSPDPSASEEQRPEPPADTDLAALMRELSSLGSDEPAPDAGQQPAHPRPHVVRQHPAAAADHRRRKGFFGR